MRLANVLTVGALTLGALGAGFLAGRVSTAAAPVSAPHAAVMPAQFQNDPREVIPLTPGPREAPGQGQQPRPGQGEQQQDEGEGEGEQCKVLLYRDGQLYEFQQPGQGQQPRPGEGEEGPGGQRGGDDEVFPLRPYDGPSPLPRPPAVPEPRRI